MRGCRHTAFCAAGSTGRSSKPTVGDVLRGKSGALPDLVHTHPSETVRDAIGILREYGVSQMPRRRRRAAGDGGRSRGQRVRA